MALVGAVFSWGVLMATALMGGVASVQGNRAGVRCELGLVPGLVVVVTLLGSPRGLSRSPKEVKFLPGMMAVSALVRGGVGAEGLEQHF